MSSKKDVVEAKALHAYTCMSVEAGIVPMGRKVSFALLSACCAGLIPWCLARTGACGRCWTGSCLLFFWELA